MITKILSRSKQILYVLEQRSADYIIVKNAKYQVVGYIKEGKTYLKNGKIISDSAVPGLLFPEISISIANKEIK